LGKKIEELSRGFKQRVGLAAALLGDPKILILDEPTSGLDPLEQEKMRVLIRKLGKEKTIIFSTHILPEVEDVASRLIIINQGKIVYDGVKPKGKGAVEKLFKKAVKN
jgi:ABC-2 type transport system ATP-binding protein